MNQRSDKLQRGCPYTRVEYLENVGWSRVFLPVYPKAGDVVEVESELCFTSLDECQAELTNLQPYLFWGVFDTPNFYCGVGRNMLLSNMPEADMRWHTFRLVSYGSDCGFWIDGARVYAGIADSGAHCTTGLQLWYNLNSSRRCLNRKKWVRVSINGQAVMHLLPVLDENRIPAFYDTVSRKLFYNSGEDALVAGPVTASTRYTPLEYIECSGSAICALQSYIMLPVEINLRADSFAFETEHELVQSNENQAEGMNIFNPMMFYGMRTNGVAYYGFGYGNTGTVADGGASVMPGSSVFRAEYDKGIIRFLRNSFLEAQIQKGIPQSEMIVRMIGVFCAVGKPVVSIDESGNAYPFNGRKKYFKVWVNNQLVAHLVAAADAAGIPCMYDIVNSRFYYSEGEGDFIAGPVLGA